MTPQVVGQLVRDMGVVKRVAIQVKLGLLKIRSGIHFEGNCCKLISLFNPTEIIFLSLRRGNLAIVHCVKHTHTHIFIYIHI